MKSESQKVIAQLTKMSARKIPITEDMEIFYDLRLYGDDLYEFLVWVYKEFGVQFHINLKEYAPGETWLVPLFWRRETQSGRYKSLKVRDILDAIQVKHWPIN